MFTEEQIMEAKAMLKSGSDFPMFFETLKNIGIKEYQTFIDDGRTEYFGEGLNVISRL